MRGEPSETARPAVVALVLTLCSNERAAPRRSSAQRAAPPPTARPPTACSRSRLQGRRASSSARAPGHMALFQLVSIISEASSGPELMKPSISFLSRVSQQMQPIQPARMATRKSGSAMPNAKLHLAQNVAMRRRPQRARWLGAQALTVRDASRNQGSIRRPITLIALGRSLRVGWRGKDGRCYCA